MKRIVGMLAALFAVLAPVPAAYAQVATSSVEVEIPGGAGMGPLRGTLLQAGANAPVVIIIPGSGPTDRDGNNPYGAFGSPILMLAQGLADAGISSIRIDKRGIARSREAIADPNAISTKLFAADARLWVDEARRRTGQPCAWIAGHSEGGLVAMVLASKDPAGICGLILLAAPGRKIGPIFRDQFQRGPLALDMLKRGLAALDSLEAGRKVDTTGFDPWLLTVLDPVVQDYMIDLLALDPGAMLAAYAGPVLIVQGVRDRQVLEIDARTLAAAQPRAKLAMLPNMTHMLKDAGDSDESHAASYRAPGLPLAAGLVDSIATFIRAPR